jgi:hypothetical protein
MEGFTGSRLGTRGRQFLLGVAVGLTAQGLRALWQWLRSAGMASGPGAPAGAPGSR